MTTNQTIDGVPRELIEDALAIATTNATAHWSAGVRDRLRALLDAPAPRAEFKKVEMAHVMNALEDVRGKPVLTSNQCHDLARALNDRLLSPLQLLAMPAEYLAAAQPQGEPIYQLEYLGEGGGGWNDVDKETYDNSAPIKSYRGRIVYAEQPAPVSSTSDKYKAELYDEVWQKARDMGFGNVTDALMKLEKQPAPVAVAPTCCGSCPGGCVIEARDAGKARDV